MSLRENNERKVKRLLGIDLSKNQLTDFLAAKCQIARLRKGLNLKHSVFEVCKMSKTLNASFYGIRQN